MEWTPLPRVTFGATETVIYGVRGLDVHYLMPFIPFWSLQHYLGDTDNIQMSGDVSLNLENGNLYAVLFIDEWRPEWTFEEKNRNWFGWQIGFTRTELFMKSDKLEGEFTWTDHRIYRHRFSINDYNSHGYPLGFWTGPHAQEIYFNYFLPFGKYNLNINYSDATRGELTRNMLEGQYNNDQYERFSGNSEHRMVIEVLIQRSFMKDQLGVQAGVEFIHWKNPGFDPYKSNPFLGGDIKKWSISVGIYYNIK